MIFSEFKTICRNSDALLKKYQIKVDSPETDANAGMKGNGKCKSIRNSEEMATRMKECALKKSISFIENMKNFYYLMNQMEEIEGSVINIKEENQLIPNVELSIKNEIIYPSEMNEEQPMQLLAGIDHSEHKRKKRRSGKRKSIGSNGETHQQTIHYVQSQHSQQSQHQQSQQPQQQQQQHQHVEIDESGNVTLTTSSGHHVQISGASSHHSEHDLGVLMAKHNDQSLLSSNNLNEN